MSRQQRRSQARKQLKQAKRGMSATRKVGWHIKQNSKINPAKNPPVGKELASIFILPPTNDRQDFEMGIREFGEAIQASDKELPCPRIEYVCVFKPFPYNTMEEMSRVCETILKKYSPYNVYALTTGTPPPGTDLTNEEHIYAFAYHLVTIQRQENMDELQTGLARAELESYNRN